MPTDRCGVWIVGAYGGVATTAALGIAALKRDLVPTTGMVTELDLFRGLNLPKVAQLVVGGHDVRRVGFLDAARELQAKSGVFDEKLLRACQSQFAEWDENIRPGTVRGSGKTVAKLSSWNGAAGRESAADIVAQLSDDLHKFKERHRLVSVVVINLASTEPPFELGADHQAWDRLSKTLRKKTATVLPSSSLYAIAALSQGFAYVNFTPSLGATVPAIEELAANQGALYGGQDGKTGETLLKSVLAPMFRYRNLEVLSWVGHNIFGNRDGLVLDDPENKKSKIKTKDQVITQILGYKPQTHVSIEYIESLDDWKTAWDHIHFRGFLGTKMILQFTWQGCDSLLAAPLVIDLARLTLFEQSRGGSGLMKHLACFFKRPLGVETHNLFEQWNLLEGYVANASESGIVRV